MKGLKQIQSFANNLYANLCETTAHIRKEVSTTVSQTAHFIHTVSQSETVRHIVYGNFLQSWQGFSRGLDLNWVTAVIKSADIQKVLLLFLKANFTYLGMVILYEMAKKGEQEEHGETIMLYLVNQYINHISFRRLSLEMAIDNTAYYLSMAQAVLNINPITEHDERACECRTIPILRAGLASSFYYIGNCLTINAISYLPYVGYMAYPLQALLYGQSLLEYKLSAIGLCTVHRYQILNRNNFYALGLGLSFLLFLQLSRYGVSYLFNISVDNPFIYDAIFSILYQHYIMIVLLIDRKFPGEQLGLDIFYYSRLLTEALLKKIWEIYEGVLIDQTKKHFSLNECVDKIMLYPLSRLFKKTFIQDEDFLSLDKFVKRSSINLFFELNGKKIKNTLENIMLLRKKTYASSLSYLADYLPNFIISNSEKKMLSILFDKKIENILTHTNQFLENVLSQQQKAQQKNEQQIELNQEEEKEKMKEPKEEVNQTIEKPPEKVAEEFIEEALDDHPDHIAEKQQTIEADKKSAPKWRIIQEYEPQEKYSIILAPEIKNSELKMHSMFNNQNNKNPTPGTLSYLTKSL